MKKTTLLLAFAIAMGGLLSSTAASAAPTAQQAKQRYEIDRDICNEERNEGQRNKCLRAVKAEYEQAQAGAPRQAASAPACRDCGRVTGVRVSKRDGQANAIGVVGGGVAGGLLGNQVGHGNGRALATVAGAIGGAFAGKKIQEKANAHTVWTVDVEYDNGHRRSFTYNNDPGVQRGDRVRDAGKSAIRRI